MNLENTIQTLQLSIHQQWYRRWGSPDIFQMEVIYDIIQIYCKEKTAIGEKITFTEFLKYLETKIQKIDCDQTKQCFLNIMTIINGLFETQNVIHKDKVLEHGEKNIEI